MKAMAMPKNPDRIYCCRCGDEIAGYDPATGSVNDNRQMDIKHPLCRQCERETANDEAAAFGGDLIDG